MTKLMLQPQMPNDFTLHSVPAGAEYEVVFQTPAERKILGRFSPANLNAGILLQLFPSWKPGAFVKLALGLMVIPPQFSMTARPDGEVIVFDLQLDVPVGPPRKWSKRIPLQDWTLAQMGEVMAFLKECKSNP